MRRQAFEVSAIESDFSHADRGYNPCFHVRRECVESPYPRHLDVCVIMSGHQLLRDSSRYLVRVLRSRYRDHKIELRELRRHIRPGDTVCDIGANKGSFTYWFSRWSSPGRTVAFEPQPDLADGLSRLCAMFALDNVVVERTAVYSSSGTHKFFIPAGHQPAASLIKQMEKSSEIEVSTISLDDYFSGEEHVSAIKIDVEGAELEVLRGAKETLIRCMPLIICECDRHLVSLERMKETFSFLSDLGYSGAFVAGSKLLPLSSFDPNIHQKTDGEWFWKRKEYYNNFIFQRPA